MAESLHESRQGVKERAERCGISTEEFVDTMHDEIDKLDPSDWYEGTYGKHNDAGHFHKLDLQCKEKGFTTELDCPEKNLDLCKQWLVATDKRDGTKMDTRRLKPGATEYHLFVGCAPCFTPSCKTFLTYFFKLAMAFSETFRMQQAEQNAYHRTSISTHRMMACGPMDLAACGGTCIIGPSHICCNCDTHRSTGAGQVVESSGAPRGGLQRRLQRVCANP